jgi:hypothetical protein
MSGDKVGYVGPSKGKVYVKHYYGAMEKAVSGVRLYTGDKVYTLGSSYVDISFDIGGSVALNENVVVEMTGPREVKNVTQTTLIQEAVGTVGEIWAKFTKQQEEVQFETKGGVLGIKG